MVSAVHVHYLQLATSQSRAAKHLRTVWRGSSTKFNSWDGFLIIVVFVDMSLKLRGIQHGGDSNLKKLNFGWEHFPPNVLLFHHIIDGQVNTQAEVL